MKAYELYKQLDPAVVAEMFITFREEEREIYKSAVASLAQARKLRPVYVQKKPVTEQIAWMHKTLTLRGSDMIGEHLLQVWFMKFHQPLLIDFCDGMGIEHNGEGSVEGALPDELDEDKLKATADSLYDKFNARIVSLYLHVFNMQTPEGWATLAGFLATDPRAALSNEPAPPPPAEEAPAEAAPAPAETSPAPSEEASPEAPEESPDSEEAPANTEDAPADSEEAPAADPPTDSEEK